MPAGSWFIYVNNYNHDMTVNACVDAQYTIYELINIALTIKNVRPNNYLRLYIWKMIHFMCVQTSPQL